MSRTPSIVFPEIFSYTFYASLVYPPAARGKLNLNEKEGSLQCWRLFF